MQQAKTRKKLTISFECIVANSFVLMALLLMLAGCVAEEPRHYYNGYPGDYSYEEPSHTTVIVHDRDDRRDYDEDRDHDHDYDNHWDYGRRGNGNFHGTDADNRHDD
jgi:hypothetical protein